MAGQAVHWLGGQDFLFHPGAGGTILAGGSGELVQPEKSVERRASAPAGYSSMGGLNSDFGALAQIELIGKVRAPLSMGQVTMWIPPEGLSLNFRDRPDSGQKHVHHLPLCHSGAYG